MKLNESESSFRTFTPSASYNYSVGHLYHVTTSGRWYSLGSNLTLSTGSLVGAKLVDNGNLVVATSEGVNVYQWTC